jgi:hypothetical protein
VLGAADATNYGNYERWEAGATRVGAKHLGAIVEAFAVDDVPMFLYAWLVDRFTPSPRQSAVDLAQVNFAKAYRQLPRTTVDLGERKNWVVEPARHADVALLYLVARYRRNHRVVLPPVARQRLPASRRRSTRRSGHSSWRPPRSARRVWTSLAVSAGRCDRSWQRLDFHSSRRSGCSRRILQFGMDKAVVKRFRWIAGWPQNCPLT